jgi:O-antigen/teichoic acid export membrane protein
MMIAGQVLAGLVFVSSRRRLLLGLLRHNPDSHCIHWWSEVWPFQWRIAVSYISGYFAFQLFIPVLFAFWGPTAAGQMGMSINISNALLTISIAWVSTKAAPFGALVARKEYGQLDHIFFRVLAQSTAVSAVNVLVIWCAVVYINARHLHFAHRILPPVPFGLLLLSMMVNHIVFAEAIYLRAHKQEKFLVTSVVGACLMTASTFLLGKRFGAMGMASGYFCINLVVGLGFCTYIFLKYRRLWHTA